MHTIRLTTGKRQPFVFFFTSKAKYKQNSGRDNINNDICIQNAVQKYVRGAGKLPDCDLRKITRNCSNAGKKYLTHLKSGGLMVT